MEYTSGEKKNIEKALGLMHQVAVNRICRRSMDAEKLARVAMCMDNFLIQHNDRLDRVVTQYAQCIAKSRARIIELENRCERVEEAHYLEQLENRQLRERINALEAALLSEEDSSPDDEIEEVRVNRVLRF